jgi:solute carrier family 13 (sodium-dependent dicarboxylate transporter), member 2/3/5
MRDIQILARWLGPVAAILAFSVITILGYDREMAIVTFVAVVCIFWWIFEPIPIPVTSLLPLAILPLFGVLTPAEVGEAYGSPLILLLLGGFILSKSMEKSGAHRRIAIGMVNAFGASSGRTLVIGFMCASAFLSMWISNTATVLMMLPVAMAVLDSAQQRTMLATPLLLGIAYAASVGGMATPIGTPPNLIFMQVYEEATGISISFSRWMGWALPVVLILIPLIGLKLTQNIRGSISVELPLIGDWRAEEKRVISIFGMTAFAWITRSEPFGGWKTWLDIPYANDASVALLAVVVVFLTPNGKGGKLLDWKHASEIPWGVLLLFSGGICLAKGFVVSGLSGVMGQWLASMTQVHVLLLIVLICTAVTFMTETTSNTASTTLLMPVLAAAAMAAGISPEVMMVPAAMSASCAFMLPVATAPNSVVFGTGLITTRRMAQEGITLNFIGVTVISLVCYVLLA